MTARIATYIHKHIASFCGNWHEVSISFHTSHPTGLFILPDLVTVCPCFQQKMVAVIKGQIHSFKTVVRCPYEHKTTST